MSKVICYVEDIVVFQFNGKNCNDVHTMTGTGSSDLKIILCK